MLKERLNLSLNEEGSKALSQIVERTGLSRTAVIEAVLIEAALRGNPATAGGLRKVQNAVQDAVNEQHKSERDADEVLREAQRKLEARRAEETVPRAGSGDAQDTGANTQGSRADVPAASENNQTAGFK